MILESVILLIFILYEFIVFFIIIHITINLIFTNIFDNNNINLIQNFCHNKHLLKYELNDLLI